MLKLKPVAGGEKPAVTKQIEELTDP